MNCKPRFRFFVPRHAVSALSERGVYTMIWALLCARLATNNPEFAVSYQCGSHGGGITFFIDSLPSRQRPTTDDMYRIPRSLRRLRDDPMTYEGRVLEDMGDVLRVLPGHHENIDGTFKQNARAYLLETKRAMKINDWKVAIRPPANFVFIR